MSRILVLLDRHQQPLPIKCLETKHEAIVPDCPTFGNSPVQIDHIPFDLCILDESNFDRLRSLVATLKTASAPIFLPFLLVSQGRISAETDCPFLLTPEQLEGRIDDLLFSPFPPTELHFRVENLLARRQLSLELHSIQEVVKERNLAENVLIASLQASNENLQREIDKRVEVEATLRSNTYLDSLMNAMPDIVCFKDAEGRWQEANQAILELFELSPERYRGLKDYELGELSSFYREALAACEVSDREAWDKGSVSRGEEVIPRSDGTIKIYDVIKIPLFYPDGKRKSLVILGRDITEHKQARDELVRLASIVESCDDGIIGKSLTGTIMSWNAGAQKIYGYEAAEVKGESIEILAIPSRPNEMSQILANIRAGATIDHYETLHLRKDGKEIDVSLTISPIKDTTGTIIGVSTIARDISDSKRVEKALEQLRHQNELILFSAGEGICGLNKEGKVTFVNPVAVRMAGCESKQLIDRPLYETIHPRQQESPKAMDNKSSTQINAASKFPTSTTPTLHRLLPNPTNSQIIATLQDGEARRVTNEVFCRRDGTSFPVEYVVAPMREQGKIIGAVVTFKDITDRLAVERMKDEFISVVSHELRTPMTSIHGALALLNSGVLDNEPEKAKRMRSIAVSNTERLVRLINDILDLERMESSYHQAVKQTCNVAELMLQAVDEMQGMADQAGVILSVVPVSAPLRAVPDRIIQTLTNLLSNAIKFSSEGATIWLSAQLRPNSSAKKAGLKSVSSPDCAIGDGDLPMSSQEILIAVKDRGRGIPVDKLEMIFERFQQVDASDSRQKGGTGLGLAICRSIVQQHGGRIWVESVLGEGSTFFLTFPVLTDAEISKKVENRT